MYGNAMVCVSMLGQVLRFEYGPESDLWSVGVIAYLLLTGHVPFDGETEKEILVKVVRYVSQRDA